MKIITCGSHTSGVQNSIKILKPDNSWIVMPYTINAPIIGDIIISRSGKKWIVLPGGKGLFVLDDNGTPENFGDDNSLISGCSGSVRAETEYYLFYC